MNISALSDDELYRIAGIKPKTFQADSSPDVPDLSVIPDEELMKVAGVSESPSPDIGFDDVTPFGPVTEKALPPAEQGIADAAITGQQTETPPEEGIISKVLRPERQALSGAISTLAGMAGFGQRLKIPGSEKAADVLEGKAREIGVKDPNFLDELGAGAGSMMSFLIPGMGIGRAASLLSKVPKLAQWAASLSAAGIEAGTEAGQVYRDMLARQAPEEEAAKAADQTAMLNALLVGVTNKLGIFGDRAAGARKALLSAIIEGGQEAGQDIISSSAKGEPLDPSRIMRSGAIGAIIGGGVGAIMPQDIGNRLKGPVRDMYEADLSRGKSPEDALDRVVRTYAGKSQVRITLEEIEKEQTEAAIKAEKEAPDISTVPDEELMDIAGMKGGELTGELLGLDAEESAKTFEPLLREQDEQAAFEEELRRSPVGAEMLRQDLADREFKRRTVNLRSETPQEAAEREVAAEREAVDKVKARMIENRQTGKSPFEGLTDAEINLAQRQAQEARELTQSPDQQAHIKKVEDAKVNAIDTRTAVDMLLDGKNITDHIEKGIAEGNNPEVVKNNLRELLVTELAKDERMLPTEKLDAEKRMNQAIADAYETHLTKKAEPSPIPTTEKVVQDVTKSNKPAGDIVSWVKSKGGINQKIERWKGELVDIRDSLNQGKRFGQGNAVVNSTSPHTLDRLAIMAHSEGLITEDTPRALLDALGGRKRTTEGIEADIGKAMEQAQASTPQTIYPDQLTKGQKVIIDGEEYVHSGVEKGRVVLKDGETIRADIFEPLEVDGVLPPPRGQKPMLSREQEEKEPWQMTAAEYSTDRQKTYSSKRGGSTDEVLFNIGQDAMRRHENIVKQAISENKPVPPSVLVDYPDLQGRFNLSAPEAKKPPKPKPTQGEMFPPSLEGPLTSAEAKETPLERAKAEEKARKTEIEEAQRQGRLLSQAPKHPGIGMAAEAVRNAIRTIASKWKVKGGIRVVETAEDLPGHLADAIRSDTGTGKIEGMYDPETGGIYLIAAHIRNHQRAQEVLFHEAVGHYGLRELMGADINPLLDKVYIAKLAEAKKVAGQYGFDTKTAEGRQKSAEEVLARMAERNEKSTWLQRAYAAIRDWLRKVGFSVRFSDNDLRAILSDARGVLEKGKKVGSVSRQPMFARETEEKPISPIKTRHHLTKSVDDFIGALSTRLKNINPQLKYALRKFEFKRMERILEDERMVKPFLQAMRKMTKADKKAFDIARMSGDRTVIEAMLKKYNMAKDYNMQRFVLNGLYSRAKGVGFSLGYLQDYSPRVLKDADGFLAALMQDKDAWSPIAEAIKNQEAELGRYLDPSEKAAMANLLLRGYKVGNISLSMTGNMKRRMIDKLTEDLAQFYYPADHSLLMYINDVNNTIEARRFFGKETGVKGLPLFEAERTAHIDDSVGAYVIKLIAEGKIRPEQEIELSRLLKSRFNEKGVTGVVKLYKDVSYIDTLGSPISAITQIGDLAFALYKSGFYRTGKALGKALIGKSELTKEDIHIQDIVEEFRGGSKASKALTKVFKYTGFEKMDALGKETVINSTLDKYRKQARNDKQGLAKKIRDIFGDETPQVIADLAEGRTTENVKLLAFNELLDVQPVALSEMPVKYLTGGNGRIFYMLKTYTMKQFDVMRNEAFSKIASGNIKETAQGMGNLVRLASMLIIANAGADEIKDFVLGRKTDFKDRVIDNALRLFGISKWAIYKAREEGLFSAVVKGILPPGKLIDSVYKDIVNGIDKGAESVQSIPVIGKVYYWWFGKGKYKTEKKEKKGQKKSTRVY